MIPMQPLIVIGADHCMRTALEPYAEVGHIEFHPTAEAAHYALADRSANQETDPDDPCSCGSIWCAHVAYAPGAYGPLVAGGGHGRLPHTGRTLVLCWDVDAHPEQPRRVVDGQVSGTDPDTRPWQAATLVSADYVVDVATPGAGEFLARLLAWKDGAHT
jgi:hypothetical protein